MLKFVKHHMSNIEGIEIFPVISFVIFGIFFLAVLFWVWKVDKKKINEISRYPLD